ncbi:MAG: ROK family protein [Pyrinomonadaceae bacterium]
MVDSPNQASHRVGIELTSAGLNAVVLDSTDAVAAARSKAITDTEPVGPHIVSLLNDLKQEFSFTGIGIAVPGLVDRDSGRVAFSANTPQHADVDLVAETKAATGLSIAVENDANAAAYGEYRLGAGRGCENLFYATLGEGVGGALIFGGEIWRGASGFAGEFGYVTINSEGMRLQDVASASNIIRRTRSRFNRDSTSSLSKFDEDQINLQAIISAAGNGDDFAQLMLERTGTYVGTVIASVINLLNVERIVVGGEIMGAKQVVIDAIVDRAKELSFEPSFRSTTIVEGELGMNAAAIGAAFIGSMGKV